MTCLTPFGILEGKGKIMGYSRNWRHSNKPVTVTFRWVTMVGCYALKFDNIGSHWDSVKGIVVWLKATVPSGEREYDDIEKVWYVHEKHFTVIKGVIEATPDFECTIFEKPPYSGGPQVQFVPLDTYIATFEKITGLNISTLEYAIALKRYRMFALKLHPDRNPDNSQAATDMRDLNEAWDVIKEKHFKIEKPKMEQLV